QSSSSLGVSLPHKWVKQWNLKKGDILNIDSVKGVLEIKPESYVAPVTKVVIDASKYGSLTRRKFDNLSKRGYDEITVLFSDESELNQVKESLKVEATMFEIVKKEKNYVLVKSISEMNNSDFESIQNRLIFLLREKIRKIVQYLETEDESILSDLLELEQANNKLAHYCMRAMHKNPELSGSFMNYTLIWAVEKLGNDFKFFAHLKPKKISKNTQLIAKMVLDNLYIVTEIYFSYDSTKAKQFYDSRKKINDLILSALKDSSCISDHPLIALLSSASEKYLYILGLLFGLQTPQSTV
ncbi:MAG: AbrB/MazE/SpoVT family DNA-binding domain-containing protein, partial [Nanoarchaeota archaeon]|nr:AbrB/MazE/SpoVT family DNA-binding domain-containing protein [Nanoarchaeota archaeon]MBU1603982.1 AbrB/MazE/SpoVT family DNA-binding domain-containing protein [Nanoarchaeota archaeon]MBU2443867.1 AbrB/MazE/SpoVT family DNA-binding domain-containing protein [Nanoarchaeota archaeon]